MKEMPASETSLGDVVRLKSMDGHGAFSDCTVKNKSKDGVTLLRPYVVTADYSTTGGVPCSLGWEEFTVSNAAPLVLLRKGEPLR